MSSFFFSGYATNLFRRSVTSVDYVIKIQNAIGLNGSRICSNWSTISYVLIYVSSIVLFFCLLAISICDLIFEQIPRIYPSTNNCYSKETFNMIVIILSCQGVILTLSLSKVSVFNIHPKITIQINKHISLSLFIYWKMYIDKKCTTTTSIIHVCTQ